MGRHGEYFLADLIESRDANNLALVAEVWRCSCKSLISCHPSSSTSLATLAEGAESQVDGVPVGLLATSTNVDLPLLRRCYALGPFHNLQSMHRRGLCRVADVECDVCRGY